MLHKYRQDRPQEMMNHIRALPLSSDVNERNDDGVTLVCRLPNLIKVKTLLIRWWEKSLHNAVLFGIQKLQMYNIYVLISRRS